MKKNILCLNLMALSLAFSSSSLAQTSLGKIKDGFGGKVNVGQSTPETPVAANAKSIESCLVKISQFIGEEQNAHLNVDKVCNADVIAATPTTVMKSGLWFSVDSEKVPGHASETLGIAIPDSYGLPQYQLHQCEAKDSSLQVSWTVTDSGYFAKVSDKISLKMNKNDQQIVGIKMTVKRLTKPGKGDEITESCGEVQ